MLQQLVHSDDTAAVASLQALCTGRYYWVFVVGWYADMREYYRQYMRYYWQYAGI